jgi:uncharacterized delta-60 repeat protein
MKTWKNGFFLTSTVILLLIMMLQPSRAQQIGTLDPVFFPGMGPDGPVNALLLQDDGVVIAGGFQTVNQKPRNRIARLNYSDGSLDSTFLMGTGFNDEVLVMLKLEDGQMLIGGKFTSYNTKPYKRIVRLNATGEVDTSFDPGAGANLEVTALSVHPDTRMILVGGEFSAFNDLPNTGYLVRLTPEGAVDPFFSLGQGADGAVTAVLALEEGKSLIAGFFTHVDGILRPGIVKLLTDGSVDFSFNPGSGATRGFATVSTLVMQPDGKILIGGAFTNYNGVTRNSIARLNANGSLDATFDPGAGVSDVVNAVLLQDDGKIVLGGSFLSVNGFVRRGIARLNANGSVDTTFDPLGGIEGAGASIYSLGQQFDGNILIGGTFASFNSRARPNIARLLADVIRPPFLSPARMDGKFSVSFDSTGGKNYTLEYKNSVQTAAWTAGPSVIGDGTNKTLTDTNSPAADQRIYRVRMQ